MGLFGLFTLSLIPAQKNQNEEIALSRTSRCKLSSKRRNKCYHITLLFTLKGVASNPWKRVKRLICLIRQNPLHLSFFCQNIEEDICRSYLFLKHLVPNF
jgi:hypothetical protein